MVKPGAYVGLHSKDNHHNLSGMITEVGPIHYH